MLLVSGLMGSIFVQYPVFFILNRDAKAKKLI